jgi:hypothetical protein
VGGMHGGLNLESNACLNTKFGQVMHELAKEEFYFLGISLFFRNLVFKRNLKEFGEINAWKVELWRVRKS